MGVFLSMGRSCRDFPAVFLVNVRLLPCPNRTHIYALCFPRFLLLCPPSLGNLGYEPVPTQDIHFKQIGFADAWRTILQTYVRPLATHHYPGYHLEGQRTLDFVVRYRPDKQSFLRPHHDASTVTLNVALNQGGVEYEGEEEQGRMAAPASHCFPSPLDTT